MTNDVYEKLGILEGMLKGVGEQLKVNTEDTKKTLEQTTKTNGRVTALEGIVHNQDKINSKLNGLLTNAWSRLEEHERQHSFVKGVMKVLGIVGMIILSVGGYFATLAIRDVTKPDIKQTIREVLTEDNYKVNEIRK